MTDGTGAQGSTRRFKAIKPPTMSNRDLELAALRAVYDEAAFDSVVHQDRPDFVLARRGGSPFGVEITEVHESETDARIHRHPEYLPNLWEGGRHMHKDDVPVLNAVKVNIADKEGNVKAVDVPAVLRETAGPDRHAQMLHEALRRKEARFDSYADGLSHVNVIMLDWHDVTVDEDGTYSASELLRPELRSALLATRFREVFAVSQTWHCEWIVRPLQMLLALETFFLVGKALESFSQDRGIAFSASHLAPLMARTVEGTDMRVYLTDHQGQATVVYRGVGLLASDEGVQILDFQDLDPPEPASDAGHPGVGPELMDDWIAHHARFVSANDFRTALAEPAVRPVWSMEDAPADSGGDAPADSA